MPSTQIVVPDELLAKLRDLRRTRNGEHDSEEDTGEDTALRAAVGELLALAPDDTANEKEYAFRVRLEGIARVQHTSETQARRRLAEFQDVEAIVDYDGVTVTTMSFVPDEVTLIEIDGKQLDGR